MSILNLARLVIYRFHEKGLEVFLINSEVDKDPEVWGLPKCSLDRVNQKLEEDEYIELEMMDDAGEKVIAVEGDWHSIPSIRGLIKHDIKVVKSLVKETIPGIERGAFFAFKEVIKKTMPGEYKALKELKDILVDRNSVQNL